MQAYLANIAFADAMVGRVLDALERSPHREKTVVVFTSDHGWYLGQKQRWHKGGLWEEATRVPLIVSAPGVTRADTTTNQPVSLVDLYPTLVDLAGLPKPGHLDGETLVPLLQDPAAKRSRPAVTAMGGRGSCELRRAQAIAGATCAIMTAARNSTITATDPHEWTNLLTGENKAADLAGTVSELMKSIPKEWRSAHRPPGEIAVDSSADGSVSYRFFSGDSLGARSSPDITGRGFEIEAEFEYNPDVDGDATVISQGGPGNGWAVHLAGGRPAFTVNYEGLHATLRTEQRLAAGHIVLRALLGADGTLGINATGLRNGARGYAPMEGGFLRQPDPGIRVGVSFGPLSAKLFPNSSPFDGIISRIRFTLLPK